MGKNRDKAIAIGSRVLELSELKKLLPSYEGIFKDIANIRSISNGDDEIKCKFRKIDKNKEAFKHHENVISILGGRGSGKTSVLLTLRKEIENGSYGKIENDAYAENNDIVLDMFLPENTENKDILGWIIGAFKKTVDEVGKSINKMPKSRLSSIWEDFDCCLSNTKNPVEESYRRLIKVYEHSRLEYKEIQKNNYSTESEYVEKSLEVLNAEVVLEEKFKAFIRELIIFQKNQSYNGMPLIHIFFDDIDLMPSKSINILNTVLKYLSLKNIVVYMGADYQNFVDAITLGFLQNDSLMDKYLMEDLKLSKGVSLKDSKQKLAYDFLNKVIPPSLRYRIPKYTISEKRKFSYNSKSDTLDEQFREILLGKIGCYESWRSIIDAIYEIIDDTPRNLINIYKYLYESKKNQEDKNIEFFKGFLELIIESSRTMGKYKNEIAQKIVSIDEKENKLEEAHSVSIRIDFDYILNKKSIVDSKYVLEIKNSKDAEWENLKKRYSEEIKEIFDILIISIFIESMNVDKVEYENNFERNRDVIERIFENAIFEIRRINPFVKGQKSYDPVRVYMELFSKIDFQEILFMESLNSIEFYIYLFENIINQRDKKKMSKQEYNEVAKWDYKWLRNYIGILFQKYADIDSSVSKTSDIMEMVFGLEKDEIRELRGRVSDNIVRNIQELFRWILSEDNSKESILKMFRSMNIDGNFNESDCRSGYISEFENLNRNLSDAKKLFYENFPNDVVKEDFLWGFKRIFEYMKMTDRLSDDSMDKKLRRESVKNFLYKVDKYPRINLNHMPFKYAYILNKIYDEEKYFRDDNNTINLLNQIKITEDIKNIKKEKSSVEELCIQELKNAISIYGTKKVDMYGVVGYFENLQEVIGNEIVEKWLGFKTVDSLDLNIYIKNIDFVKSRIENKSISIKEKSFDEDHLFLHGLNMCLKSSIDSLKKIFVEVSYYFENEALFDMDMIELEEQYRLFISIERKFNQFVENGEIKNAAAERYFEQYKRIASLMEEIKNKERQIELNEEHRIEDGFEFFGKEEEKSITIGFELLKLAFDFEKLLENKDADGRIHSKFLDFIANKSKINEVISSEDRREKIEAYMIFDVILRLYEELKIEERYSKIRDTFETLVSKSEDDNYFYLENIVQNLYKDIYIKGAIS